MILKKIMPTAYLLIFLILTVCLHLIFPIKRVLEPPYSFLGVVFVVFGSILNVWADRLFMTYKTTVKPYENPTTLIVSGAFRISRHPMYLGMASIMVGVAIILGSVITSVIPVLFIVIMEILFIPDEEKAMESAFGEKYRDYRAKVRRWI